MITSHVTLTDTPWKEVLQFAITLFILTNPFAGATVFLTLTNQQTPLEKIKTARKTAIATFVTLFIVIWLGNIFINTLGIHIAAFKMGGGLIILLFGLNMLEFINIKKNKFDTDIKKNIAVVPLAIPIIAGPGVFAVTLTQIHNTFDSLIEKFIITLVTLILVLFIWAFFRAAAKISEFLGENGLEILVKLMGMILIVLAMQMMMEGLVAIFPALST